MGRPATDKLKCGTQHAKTASPNVSQEAMYGCITGTFALLGRLLEANCRSVVGRPPALGDPVPSEHLVVLTCMDVRIDPLQIFGLRLGQAHVLRNAGARVTEDVIRSVAISQQALGTDTIIVMPPAEFCCGPRTSSRGHQRHVRTLLGNEMTSHVCGGTGGAERLLAITGLPRGDAASSPYVSPHLGTNTGKHQFHTAGVAVVLSPPAGTIPCWTEP